MAYIIIFKVQSVGQAKGKKNSQQNIKLPYLKAGATKDDDDGFSFSFFCDSDLFRRGIRRGGLTPFFLRGVAGFFARGVAGFCAS